MKIIYSALLLLAAFCVQAAQTVYVTDQLEILLRSGQGTEFKIISSLETGAPLTVTRRDKGNGWTRVRTQDKKTGWVLTRFLTDTPVARLKLDSANKKLASLQEETTRVKEELNILKTNNNDTVKEHETLSKEKNELIQELTSIRQASSQAVQIQSERDQLQERVVNLERDLQKIKREKQTLEDSSSQDWFLIGAGVLLGGILIGIVLPKLSWKRKSTRWDSF